MAFEAFSSIDLVAQCMADEERSEAFNSALREVVSPGDTVLDVGTGTGLLALFAARAGAERVTALEFDPFVAGVAERNAQVAGYGHKIDVRVGDATRYDYLGCRPFDVVVMELLTTGMIDEMQVAAINNLHIRGLITPSTRLVPSSIKTIATPVMMDFDVCGFNMSMVRHLWKGFPDRERANALSEGAILSKVEFGALVPESVSRKIRYSVERNGTLNAVMLQSETVLSSTVAIADTLALNAPVVVPLPSIFVSAGDEIELNISYIYGGGFEKFSAKITDHCSGRVRRAA